MPKIKKGLEYFDIDTDVNNDMRVKLLRAEYGIKGFGIWIQLLIQIYADEGYFMKWDNDTKLLFASDVGESGGLVDEVVNGSVKRGLFDQSVFDQFGVLTSKHIQEKYFNAIKRRTTETQIDGRYLVIPNNTDIIKGNDNIKLINVNITEQSRVEYSKEEKSKVNNSHSQRGRAYEPNQLDPPESVEDVIKIGQMKAVPQEACEVYWDMRSTDNFLRTDKSGQWKPILNWHADLCLLFKKGALDLKQDKPKHKNGYYGNNSSRKTKGDRAVEFLSR